MKAETKDPLPIRIVGGAAMIVISAVAWSVALTLWGLSAFGGEKMRAELDAWAKSLREDGVP